MSINVMHRRDDLFVDDRSGDAYGSVGRVDAAGLQHESRAMRLLVADEPARDSKKLAMGGCNRRDRADLLEYA
jgi:hypothetical protein